MTKIVLRKISSKLLLACVCVYTNICFFIAIKYNTITNIYIYLHYLKKGICLKCTLSSLSCW